MKFALVNNQRLEATPKSKGICPVCNSPVIALNELVKQIDTNEMLLKRKQRETGMKTTYKSRYKEMRDLIQKVNNRKG